MSADTSLERRDDAPVKRDHRRPLSQRELLELYRYAPAIRPYLFAALGALAMVFLVMFMSGSDIGAVILVIFGLATLLFRWWAAPPFFLFFLCYFQVFPFGFPDFDTLYNDPLHVRDSHFRIADVVLVFAVLVYLRCQYCIFGLVHQAMPFENVIRRRGDHPVRRPTSHIDPVELGWLLGTAAVLVAIGQVVWWLVNEIDFTPTEEFPFRWADPDSLARYSRRARREPGEYGAATSRFFVLMAVLFFGFLMVRLVFGYWRLRVMNAAEGATILTETNWTETHRERVRVEKWRLWSIQRAAEEKRKADLEDRARRAHERAARARAEARTRERERDEERERDRNGRDERRRRR
jgi:hypothetical protein